MFGGLNAVSGTADQERSLTPAITVVLAESHDSMRRGMRSILDEEPGIDVVGEARDIDAARQSVGRLRPHVLVLAVHLAGKPQFAAVATFNRAGDAKIVVASMLSDAAYAEQVLRAGAVGYVCKDRADAELVPAVRAAARGECYVSALVAGRLRVRRRA